MSIIGIAQSGMRASQARLTASASNVANASNTGTIPAPATFGPIGKTTEENILYRPLRTEQTTLPHGGVTTRNAPIDQPYTLRYQPDSLSADTYGMVAAPRIDLTQEATEQLASIKDFKANAKVLETANTLNRSTLEIWV